MNDDYVGLERDCSILQHGYRMQPILLML